MTSRTPLENSFFVQNLRVFSVEASAQPADGARLTWTGSFGPFETHGELVVHLVIATLTGASSTGHASITVGGLMTPISPGTDVEKETIANSSALETMYDFAKIGLRQVASSIGAKIKLPVRSPAPELKLFEVDDTELTSSPI
jgi:hypothetical protein